MASLRVIPIRLPDANSEAKNKTSFCRLTDSIGAGLAPSLGPGILLRHACEDRGVY